MIWVLVVIGFSGSIPHATTDSVHTTMDECFDRREDIIKILGRPIIDYQAVCLRISNLNRNK